MKKSEFERHWLHDGTPFEVYEARDLKYAVWGYYKAVLSTDNGIQAFENLIRKSFLGIGRKEYEDNKRFLMRILGMLRNPEIRFRVVGMVLGRDGKEWNRYVHLIQDNDGQMSAGMLLSDEYCQVKGIEPGELLRRFPVEEYLRETGQMDMAAQYERIMSRAAGGKL